MLKEFLSSKTDARVNKPELHDYMQSIKAQDIVQRYIQLINSYPSKL